VQVVARGTKKLPDLQLVEGAWIEGRVLTTDDRPIQMEPGMRNRLRVGLHGPSRPTSGAAVESCAVDEEGRFRFRVPAGLNRPYVMSQAYLQRPREGAQLTAEVEVRDGETVKVTLRVVDAEPPTNSNEIEAPEK
jgi:hypothetical protein